MASAGVAAISGRMLDAVERHTANIGADVSRMKLANLEHTLLEEAKKLCYARKYAEAIDHFTHALAVCEKSRAVTDVPVRAAIVHNLGYCLHCLGEWEAAEAYYEEALAYFRSVKTPAIERYTVGLLYGDVNQSRMKFIKERLLDISFRRLPEDEYLDEFGKKRPMPVVDDQKTGGGDEARGPVDWEAAERRPGWLAVSQQADAGPSGGTPAARSVQVAEEHRDARRHREEEPEAADDEQEAARKEWLAYHLQCGEWEAAAELVVTKEEREDLDYLQEREERQRREEAERKNHKIPFLVSS